MACVALPQALQLFVHCEVFDDRLHIGRLEPAVCAQLVLRENLEDRLEANRLVRFELQVGDIGIADDFEIFGFGRLPEILRHQTVQDFDLDFFLETKPQDRLGRLSLAEPGYADVFRQALERLVGLFLNFCPRDFDFEFACATLGISQCQLSA